MKKFNAIAAASVLAAAAFFGVQASADDSTGDSASATDSASAADATGSSGENGNSAFAVMASAPNVPVAHVGHSTSHGTFGYKYKLGTLSRVSSKTSE